MQNTLTLEKILQQQGFGTRKECRYLIYHKKVLVNNILCDNPYSEFELENLTISVNDIKWICQQNFLLLMHKPVNYECSQKPTHYPSVMDLLPDNFKLKNVQPIGRLDANTSGLLLLTDHGQLNHFLTSPKHKIPRIYHATCDRKISQESINLLQKGILLRNENNISKVQSAQILDQDKNIVEIVLTEGKYHEVRRLIAAVGNHVNALKRIAFGEFSLLQNEYKNLKAGEFIVIKNFDFENYIKNYKS